MYTLERNRIYDLAQPVSAEFSKGTSSLSSTWLLSTAGILSTADQWIADKSGNENRVLAIYDSANTVRVHETTDNGSTWYPIFERSSQIDSFGSDADLSADYLLIGVPTFRNGTGKIESWYLDSEISASTLNTSYSGWNMVTYTNEDTYDGLIGTNTLSSNLGLGYNVSIETGNIIIASTSGDNLAYTTLDVFEFNRSYKGNLQIKRFSSTVKVKMVETNFDVKILETGTEGRYNIYDPINDFNIGLIYPSKDFLQSNASGNPKLNQNVIDDTKMQAPDGSIDQIVQLNNTSLSFKDESTNNIKYYSFSDGEYKEIPNAAVLYNEPTVIDEDYINELSAPRVILSGMDYGYFGEMPINDISHDFDYGELYIDMFNLHNELDYKYDTDAYVQSDGANSTVYLNNTRDYERIGVNDNIIWITYRVGQNYEGVVEGVTPLPDGYSYNTEDRVVMSKTTQTTGYAFDYPYIERFAGSNRTTTTAHKSNIYSIEIINSNLNTNIKDLTTRNYIQTIVERAILQFQDNVAPIHTQLWKIIWKGL